MDHLIKSVRAAVTSENWYAALALALTIPDICARIETPQEPSSRRFVRWWSENLLDSYTKELAGGPQVFLHAEDAYALRCAFLHEGRSDIQEQRARKAASDFRFIAVPPGMMFHCNLFNSVLQLQVDIFCEDICNAAERWAEDLPEDHAVPPLREIHVSGPHGVSF